MNEKWIKQAKELAMRPYFVKVIRDETTDGEPIYLANVLELEGCFGQGETPEDALADLQLAMVDYIASLLEDDLPVPNPADFVATTSSAFSKTVSMSVTSMDTPKTANKIANKAPDPNIVFNSQNNIYIPAG
jgi:predicted RNase H-like HicB family nuclease